MTFLPTSISEQAAVLQWERLQGSDPHKPTQRTHNSRAHIRTRTRTHARMANTHWCAQIHGDTNALTHSLPAHAYFRIAAAVAVVVLAVAVLVVVVLVMVVMLLRWRSWW